jgi:hypothetical protein
MHRARWPPWVEVPAAAVGWCQQAQTPGARENHHPQAETGAQTAAPPTARAEIIALRCVVVEPQHLLVTDLEEGQCRYPFGEGPFTFCGHAQKDGSSYCRPHAALTVNPDFYRGRQPRQAAE